MFRRILVPVDGSVFAEQALPHALHLAATSKAELRIVMVHGQPTVGVLRESAYATPFTLTLPVAEQAYLADVARRIREASRLEVETALIAGVPAKALGSYVRARDIDLVVMSTHGRGGLRRAWLGSVADALVRRLRVPILLVRPHERSPSEIEPANVRRVLVALDGSTGAEDALPVASDVCALYGSACTLLRVIVPPRELMPVRMYEPEFDREYIEDASREAAHYLSDRAVRFSPHATSTVVVHANPAMAILDHARGEHSDLIVVGTRGAGRVARMVLGSVADKVLRASTVPVLVCPSPRPAQPSDLQGVGSGSSEAVAVDA